MNLGINHALNRLTTLTQNIRNWNIIGQSLLPELQLVILMHKKSQIIITTILQDLQAEHIYTTNSISQQMYQQPNKQNKQDKQNKQKKQNKQNKQDKQEHIYSMYKMRKTIYGSIHLIRGLDDQQIRDEDFRERRKIVERFVRNRAALFLVFQQSQYLGLVRGQHCLTQLGYAQNSNKFILCTDHSKQHLYIHITLKYQQLFNYDLITNYKLMKSSKKQLQKQLIRYTQWNRLLNNQIDSESYALYTFKGYADSMKSSFSGTYSSSVSRVANEAAGKSIHWRVSELLAGFWEMEGDLLFKRVDGMPLKYIQQQYKISDYYSIGGFLPDTCFKQIFSPPLLSLQNSLQKTIQSIILQVLSHIQTTLNFTFKNTSILDRFTELELSKIEQNICQGFQNQFRNALTSQIQYVYATAEEFWNFSQLKSNLYSPQQQIYLEIKYIGKAYVKRVFQRMKQNVPRMIYQNLLRKIVKYFSTESFDTYLTVLRQIKFQIVIAPAQLEAYQEKNRKLKQLDKLVRYFSLKISSEIFIRKFHEKKERDWERMFGREEGVVREVVMGREREKKGGVLEWMRNLMTAKKKKKRARSESKIQTKAVVKNEENPSEENRKILNQKHWLLIINVGKQISREKLIENAAEGFPIRFRASIWVYLATKSSFYRDHIKLAVLLEKNEVQPEVRRQIAKDVVRTPPPSIFRYSLRESLTRVLEGYSIYDKQLQYTQGMNYMVAVVLLVLTNYQEQNTYKQNLINYSQIQEKAFLILKYLMLEKGVRKIMKVNADLLSQLSLRLQTRIGQLSSIALQAIQNSLFNCQMIFSSPLISCLSGVLADFRIKKRIMDLLMVHDIYVVYKIIAQFVAASQLQLAQMKTDHIYDYLKSKMYDQVYNSVGEKGLTMMFQNL